MPQNITYRAFREACELVDDVCDSFIFRPTEHQVYDALFKLGRENKAARKALNSLSGGRKVAVNSRGDVLVEARPLDVEQFQYYVSWVKEELNDDGSLTARCRDGVRNITHPRNIWKKLVERNPFIQPCHVNEALRSLDGNRKNTKRQRR